MISVIASALVETLVKHMFNKVLNEMEKIEIGGAPSWYMKEIDDQMCSFAYAKAGLDSIDIAKKKAKFKMIKDINGLINIVVYENIKNITNQKEQDLVNNFKNDPNLKVFTDANLRYSKVVYEDEIDTTFVRACIPKKTIITYQENRLKTITKALSVSRSDQALSDLDKEFE